jgi:hypothetical protein
MPDQDMNFEKLSREEWDFEASKRIKEPRGDDSANRRVYPGCPRNEAEFCYQYEFMRSVGIKHMRDKAITSCEVSKRFFGLCGKHFPTTPWLMIPEKERGRIMLGFTGAGFDCPALFRCSPSVFQGKDAAFEDVFGVDAGGVKHFTAIPFVISWHQSDEEILKAFEQWLTANAPPENHDCKIKFAGKDSRAAMVTALKQLGAYRLCPERSVTAAVAYTQKKKKDAPLYSQRTWRQNADRAKHILDHWLDSLGPFFKRHPTAASELCKMLSEKNRLEMGKQKLKEWLTVKITPWGARRYLILKDATIRSRLELVCRYGGDEEPKRILEHRQNERLIIGLDKQGNRLSCK